MNTQAGKGVIPLIIVLIVAMGLVWFIHNRISNIEEPGNYEFAPADMDYGNSEPTEESLILQEVQIQQDEAEIQTITETSNSTDLLDIEADLDFDLDSNLGLEELDQL